MVGSEALDTNDAAAQKTPVLWRIFMFVAFFLLNFNVIIVGFGREIILYAGC